MLMPETYTNISIHAPLRERLVDAALTHVGGSHFNPRSLAGATKWKLIFKAINIISIHAPLRERR